MQQGLFMEYDEKEDLIENLKKMKCYYLKAKGVCDPLEYKIRQRDLVYAMAELLLVPLNEYEKKCVSTK